MPICAPCPIGLPYWFSRSAESALSLSAIVLRSIGVGMLGRLTGLREGSCWRVPDTFKSICVVFIACSRLHQLLVTCQLSLAQPVLGQCGLRMEN
jgi:hypothetical protein